MTGVLDEYVHFARASIDQRYRDPPRREDSYNCLFQVAVIAGGPQPVLLGGPTAVDCWTGHGATGGGGVVVGDICPERAGVGRADQGEGGRRTDRPAVGWRRAIYRVQPAVVRRKGVASPGRAAIARAQDY